MKKKNSDRHKLAYALAGLRQIASLSLEDSWVATHQARNWLAQIDSLDEISYVWYSVRGNFLAVCTADETDTFSMEMRGFKYIGEFE